MVRASDYLIAKSDKILRIHSRLAGPLYELIEKHPERIITRFPITIPYIALCASLNVMGTSIEYSSYILKSLERKVLGDVEEEAGLETRADINKNN